jgi:hypothetical protein
MDCSHPEGHFICFRAAVCGGFPLQCAKHGAAFRRERCVPEDSEFDEVVKTCAVHCLEDVDPRACVKRFTSQPVGIHGWAQPDADFVAEEALKIISRITGKNSLIGDDAE